MLYSREFHESSECALMAGGTRRAIRSFASFLRGDGGKGRRGTPVRAIQYGQNFGAKEAQSISMNSGYPRLISRFSRFVFSRLVNRGALAALTVLLAGLGLNAPAHAQSASTWNKRGQDAELREDYDTAYTDYLKAKQK